MNQDDLSITDDIEDMTTDADNIPTELSVDTNDLTPSPDIAQYYSESESSSTHDLDKFIKERISALPQGLRESLENAPIAVNEEAIFEQEEGFLYYTAFSYYNELVKTARKYNKAYCKRMGMEFAAHRVLENPKLGLRYAKAFNRFLYTISVRRKALQKLHSDIIAVPQAWNMIVKNARTSDEAALKAAYSLEFLDSFEFKLVGSTLHQPALQKVKDDSRFLSSVRLRAEFEEEQKQICDASYVNPARRESWLSDLKERVQAEIEKVKGAV